MSILASAGKTCVVTLACTMINSLLLSRSAAEPTFANGVTQGTVIADDINEDSGMTVSRHNEGVLWVHNDHGDSARIFAVNAQADYLGAFDLSGAGANDYEDLAIGRGPAPGVSYLYVGDIGDNDATGSGLVTVYRLPEPAVHAAHGDQSRPIRGSSVDRITLEYPDGPHNAETLMFDPLSGDLLIATKEANKTRVYRASAGDLADPALDVVSLSLLAQTEDIEMSTAGDISPTGGEIIIKNYTGARIWTRWPGESVGEAMTRAPAVIPLQEEPMGEAIAFDAIGSGYFTHSENGGSPGGSGPSQPLYYYGRTSDDGLAAPLTLVSAGAPWQYLDDGSDQGTRWRNDADFDDSSWQTGEGQFGYGDGDEWTTVAYGDDPGKKHITTYFRKKFEVDDPREINGLILKMVYDDGAAVYLNGTEIARPNLAATAAFDHLADETQSLLEDTWFEFLIDPGLLPDLLLDGTNTLGVEIHQASPTSSDISFDLQLLATARATPEPLTWDNQGGDFNWATAANWNSDQVPNANAETTIANGDTVLLDSPGREAKSVSVEGGSALHIATTGQLTVAEDMAIGSFSKLEIDVSGSACGRADVTGLLQLDASASLALDWVPSGSTSKFGGDFVVATYGTLTGEFDTVGGGNTPYSIGEAYVAGVDYVNGDQITVSLHSLLDADADLDGDVDFGDYMILEASFGGDGEWKDGDFDLDGDVDFGDYMILEAAFGDSVPAEATAAVPEPGTLAMLLGGLVGLVVLLLRRT